MMHFLKRYQSFVIGAALVLAAFVAFSIFFRPAETPALTATSVSQAQNPVDQQMIALLLTLHSITLDNSLFDNPTFMSLKDFGRELVPEPVGRENPFAPLTP